MNDYEFDQYYCDDRYEDDEGEAREAHESERADLANDDRHS